MNESAAAKLFRAKGFKYVALFKTEDNEIFGDPIYFKDAQEVGPFMRENNVGMVWTKPIDEMIG
jgi:hypothetical protein